MPCAALGAGNYSIPCPLRRTGPTYFRSSPSCAGEHPMTHERIMLALVCSHRYRNRYRGRNRYRFRNRLLHASKTDCDCDCDPDPDGFAFCLYFRSRDRGDRRGHCFFSKPCLYVLRRGAQLGFLPGRQNFDQDGQDNERHHQKQHRHQQALEPGQFHLVRRQSPQAL